MVNMKSCLNAAAANISLPEMKPWGGTVSEENSWEPCCLMEHPKSTGCVLYWDKATTSSRAPLPTTWWATGGLVEGWLTVWSTCPRVHCSGQQVLVSRVLPRASCNAQAKIFTTVPADLRSATTPNALLFPNLPLYVHFSHKDTGTIKPKKYSRKPLCWHSALCCNNTWKGHFQVLPL